MQSQCSVTSFGNRVKTVICLRNVKRASSIGVKPLNCNVCSEQYKYCRQASVFVIKQEEPVVSNSEANPLSFFMPCPIYTEWNVLYWTLHFRQTVRYFFCVYRLSCHMNITFLFPGVSDVSAEDEQEFCYRRNVVVMVTVEPLYEVLRGRSSYADQGLSKWRKRVSTCLRFGVITAISREITSALQA